MDGWEDANKRPLLVPNPADPNVYQLSGRQVVYGDDDLIPDETSKHPIYVGNFKALGTLFVRKGIGDGGYRRRRRCLGNRQL